MLVVISLVMVALLGLTQLWILKTHFRCHFCRFLLRKAPRWTELFCPQCGQPPCQEVSFIDVEKNKNVLVPKSCHRCNREVFASEGVNLWDGETYCKSCVVSVDRTLLVATIERKFIQELSPWRIALEVGLSYFVFVFSVVLLFVLLLVWVAVSANAGPNPINIFLYLLQIPLGIATFHAIAAAGGYHLGRRIAVAVKNGQVVKAPGSFATCKLNECHWKIGTIKNTLPESFQIPLVFLRRTPVIILILPKSAFASTFKNEIDRSFPVGTTPDSFRLWKSFLTLAKVPNDELEQ